MILINTAGVIRKSEIYLNIGTMAWLSRFYSLSRFKLFILIITGNLILVWLSRSVLINEIVFYNAYSEQLTYERAVQLFNDFQSIGWLSYIFIPVMLILKFSLVSLLVYTGIILRDLQYKVPMGSVFKIVIASDVIFLLAGTVKFLWFYFFAGNYDLNDIGFFYPLSLTNLFSTGELRQVWILPMQSVNLFHVGYLLLLSYGLSSICRIERHDAERIVLSSYLPGLALWLTVAMFITLNASS